MNIIILNINHNILATLTLNFPIDDTHSLQTNNAQVRTPPCTSIPASMHNLPCTIFHAQATLLYSPTTVTLRNPHQAGVCPRSEPAEPGGQSKGHTQIQSSPTAAVRASIGERSDSERSLSDRFFSEGRSAEKILAQKLANQSSFCCFFVAWKLAAKGFRVWT
jgi:hypothetical protein